MVEGSIQDADVSNVGALHLSSHGSGSSHTSINQVILNRPIKRKLFQEFEDSAEECDQLIQPVQERVRFKMFRKHQFYSRGECSRTNCAESDVKSGDQVSEDFDDEDSKNCDVNLKEEEIDMNLKSDFSVVAEPVNKVCDDCEIPTMLNVGEGLQSLGKNLRHIEIVDLTLLDDEGEDICVEDVCMKECIDLSESEMSDNFVILVEEEHEDGECIEVVYLSD